MSEDDGLIEWDIDANLPLYTRDYLRLERERTKSEPMRLNKPEFDTVRPVRIVWNLDVIKHYLRLAPKRWEPLGPGPKKE